MAQQSKEMHKLEDIKDRKEFKFMENYDDIINLPHHVSTKHPQLSREQRAAQFAPFAALTGYGEAVNETVKLNEEKFLKK